MTGDSVDDLAEYDEARRDLGRLKTRLEAVGNTMRDVGQDLNAGRSLDGYRRRSVSDICGDLAEFEPTLTQYRETRQRAEAAYNRLINAGRESILDLSKFPNY